MSRHFRLSPKILAAAFAAPGLIVASAAAAAKDVPEDFIDNCAVCHGKSATGDGPMAENLSPKPADLTLLSKKNGGDFPYLRVRATIDGRVQPGLNVRGHGPAEMPVWGKVFYYESGQSETAAKARILNILDYLVSIQKK